MGIKNFNAFLEKYAPKSVKTIKDSELKGKIILIDASIYVYKAHYGIRKPLINSKGKNVNVLYVLTKKIIKLLELGAKPIFIYDGKPPEIKSKTIEKRKSKSKESIADAIKDSIELLEQMKIPYIKSPYEADIYCAALSRDENVYGVLSEDNDMLMFGVKRLLKQSKGNKYESIELNNILNETKLTLDNFIDMCILMGNDYIDETHKNMYTKIVDGKLGEFLQKLPKNQLSKYWEVKDYVINGHIKKIILKISEIERGNYYKYDIENLKKYLNGYEINIIKD